MKLTTNNIAALAVVVLTMGTNLALYLHLSATMNSRFDSIDHRLELLAGKLVAIDNRVIRIETRTEMS